MRYPAAPSVIWAAIIFVLSIMAIAPAQAAARVALVIGNGGYANIQSLKNPARDAADMAAKLEDLGFDVILGIDADRQQFGKLLGKALDRAKDAGSVVFYYAGHGFEVSGANRLVPVDAVLRDRARIADETIDANDVIARLNASGQQLIVLLDACRNSPLPKGIKLETDGEGLAKIEGGRDIFVAFATEPRQVAGDGKGRNSAFTKALLTHMERPGLSIADMMVDVRRDVFASTKGKQLPWDQSSLKSSFYFVAEGDGKIQISDSDRNSSNENEAQPTGKGSGKSTQLDSLSSGAVLQPIETSDEDKASDSEPRKSKDNVGQIAKRAAPAVANKRAAEVAKPKQNKAQKKVTAAPAAGKKNKQAAKGNRPNARTYSFQIWGERSIPHGASSASTPYGILRCRAHYSGWEDTEQRSCSWK